MKHITDIEANMDKRILEFDGLRGLAVLCVIMAHYSPITFLDGDNTQHFLPLMHTFALPNFAVALFYGLSAFLLSYLAVLEIEKNQHFSIKKFYIRRILRIWPLYLFALMVSLLLTCPGFSALSNPIYVEGIWHWSISHIWQWLTFIYNWSLTFNGVNNYFDHSLFNLSHFWSISVEEQFYIFFPLLILTSIKCKKSFKIIIFSIIFLGLVCRATAAFIAPSTELYYATFSYFDCFAVCGALGVLFAKRGKFYDSLHKFVSSRYAKKSLIFLLLCFLFIWSHYIWSPHGSVTETIFSITSYTLLAVFSGWLLFFVIADKQSFFSRLMRTKFFYTLGVLSYGIYIWHFLLLILLRYVDIRLVAPLLPPYRHVGVVLLFLLYMMACIIVANFSYIFVEKPFLRKKMKMTSVSALTEKSFDPLLQGVELKLWPLKNIYYVGLSALIILCVSKSFFSYDDTGYLTAVRLKPNLIRLKWMPLLDSASYVIYMENSDNKFHKIGKASGRTLKYDIHEVSPSLQYSFILNVCDEKGQCRAYQEQVDVPPYSQHIIIQSLKKVYKKLALGFGS